MSGFKIDAEEVGAIVAATRSALLNLPSPTESEQLVKDGSTLLRHEDTTPMLNTVAERLQEMLTQLTSLTGDVIDALESAVIRLAGMQAAAAEDLDRVRRQRDDALDWLTGTLKEQEEVLLRSGPDHATDRGSVPSTTW